MLRGQPNTSRFLLLPVLLFVGFFVTSIVSADQWRVESRDIQDHNAEVLWEQNYHEARMSKANGVATDNSGVYTVGYQYNSGGIDWRVEKRNPSDGVLLWEQIYKKSDSGGFAHAQSVAVDSSGVYIVGYENDGWTVGWRIEKRSLIDGALIWERTEALSDIEDIAYGVTVDSSGVYVVGYDAHNQRLDAQWRIEKRSLTDGERIWQQISNPSDRDDIAFDVAVNGSGLYVVGVDGAVGDFQWRIEKRNFTDGALVWEETFNPGQGYDYAKSVALSDFGVYVAGYKTPSDSMDSEWRIEMHSPEDGRMIWEKTSNPSSGPDQLYDIAVKNWGLYLVGSDAEVGYPDIRWVTEYRSFTSGYLFWSRTSNPSSYLDEAQAVAVTNDNQLIAVGYDNAPRPCPSGELMTWEVDGNVCSGYTTATEIESRDTVGDDTGPTIGSAVYQCNLDSNWMWSPDLGATCSILPDLTAVSNTPVAEAILSPTEPITFTGAAVNSEDAVIADGGLAILEIEWEDGTFESYPVLDTRLGDFSPGEAKSLLYTLPALEVPNGTHRYRFRVDADGSGVVESDETNNASDWTAFMVTEPMLNGSNCVIPEGENTCLGYFSWLIASAEGPNIFNETTDQVCQEVAEGSGQPCGLQHGRNLIQARDGDRVLRDITVSAECGENDIWNTVDKVCAERPESPKIDIGREKKLIRQGGRVSLLVTINDPDNDLVCSVYGVDPVLHPDLGTFMHQPSINPLTTKTFTTKELKAAQIIQVVCTETAYGIKTTEEIRVEVTPAIREL
jgi:hypothetical protein